MYRLIGFVAVIALVAASVAALSNAEDPAKTTDPGPAFQLKPGDHICIIGNTLAERMQHDGWLETLLHARFPKHHLVIRNLGFSADEITTRLRSMDFGTPDEWLSGVSPIPQPRKLTSRDHVRANRFELTNTKADVIFAFFGYNESFAGEAGLPKFKQDLDRWIKHTLEQKYNGRSSPRLVLFSPVAVENRFSSAANILPVGDPENANKRIKLYSQAMAETARSNHIPFVDVESVTTNARGTDNARPRTINGVHLNEYGNLRLADRIREQLFVGGPDLLNSGNRATFENLRQAVLDKNFYWFNRYRAVDGYSTFGDRAFLKFEPDQQSNYEVVQRELEVLDVMTSNRDKRIWALASGEPLVANDPAINDSNIPPFIPVKTNKPGKLPGGKHEFLDPTQAIKSMTVAKNMTVNLFASEKEFPDLVNPVQTCWDTKGRLWVAVWPTYPHWKPTEPMNDKLLILEDTDGDGKADKCTTFADKLHNPTGFEFVPGGVLVAQAPDLMFIEIKPDGTAGRRERVLHGLDAADTHHTSNSFVLDPGGAVYFQEGTFHHTQVETPWGPPVRNVNAGVYRYEPRTHKFDVYVAFDFANPHGHCFDHWGQDMVVDGTGSQVYHATLFSGHLDFPNKHNHPPQVYQQRTRPCPGIEILSSNHFPQDMQGNLLVPNVIGFQGILQYKLHDQGASFGATEVEPILSSTDPNFRPSDLKVGPDGAIYFLDWHNPIIGHMQHNLRDPSRDREHGRIYRVTYNGRPLSKPPAIAGQPIEKLLDALKSPEDRVRYRARIELANRDGGEVLPAAIRWLAALDSNDPNYEHHRLEALWLHQNFNVVNEALLRDVLHSKEFRARAAAVRVLCAWRDRVPGSLNMLKRLAADPHPRVRLEAVRAASFFAVPEAVEVVLITAEQPSDPYIEFVRGETMRALDPYVKKAIASGTQINFTSDAGARYFLRRLPVDELLKMKRTRGIDLEILSRKGVSAEDRKSAVEHLAKLEGIPPIKTLIDVIQLQDGQSVNRDPSVGLDLIRLLTSGDPAELSGYRNELRRLATESKQLDSRQIGIVSLIAADGSADEAWILATKSVRSLQDFLSAIPLIRDPGHRAALYPRIESLLHGLPAGLASEAQGKKSILGRFVRVSLPGPKRTLSIAEVEVFSDGRNIARSGMARQKSTASGGVASRGIDGKTSGRYQGGGITHTVENIADPWWELDLGGTFPIESITIYNRTDGTLGNRLQGFTLTVLDDRRTRLYEVKQQPAPAPKSTFAVSSSPETLVRRAAMLALTTIRGKEEQTFKALTPFLIENRDRAAAVTAMLRIPSQYWPAADAKSFLDAIVAHVAKLPATERTSQAILDELQLGDGLASLLPKDQAKLMRRQLGELGVRQLRVGTVLDQMLYDKERLAVRAGKPFEIVFENSDLMPHNFVLLQPGSLEEVGNLAEAQATEPGALERQYVPRSNKVLLSSRMVQPRESQKLSFTAPTQPGIYPYVCTYPGHWRRMFGALYVVEDLDEYLADSEAYLAAHPLPIRDELLKFNRPRKEWTLAELESAVPSLGQGRSFANGKQMFTVANCIACHKMNGIGHEIGPDLMKLEEKFKPADILHDILEPSWRINEKYQNFDFELTSGKTVTGLIVEENSNAVKIIENPLAKAEPIVIKKSQIAERSKSRNSAMPKGLLDKLTREEILDLLAYVVARGDEKNAVFHGPGHKH